MGVYSNESAKGHRRKDKVSPGRKRNLGKKFRFWGDFAYLLGFVGKRGGGVGKMIVLC